METANPNIFKTSPIRISKINKPQKASSKINADILGLDYHIKNDNIEWMENYPLAKSILDMSNTLSRDIM